MSLTSDPSCKQVSSQKALLARVPLRRVLMRYHALIDCLASVVVLRGAAPLSTAARPPAAIASRIICLWLHLDAPPYTP